MLLKKNLGDINEFENSKLHYKIFLSLILFLTQEKLLIYLKITDKTITWKNS